jgi:hypothetical protein
VKVTVKFGENAKGDSSQLFEEMISFLTSCFQKPLFLFDLPPKYCFSGVRADGFPLFESNDFLLQFDPERNKVVFESFESRDVERAVRETVICNVSTMRRNLRFQPFS